ncbi:NAD(P)H-hydrate dehydratase [Microbacterium sp. NPDC058345]|uniref:ADP-dependent NAD(P)H-hydrate dehydratase n=1 Tax=Microbacterium sp. NPDC058345 TaxID=3346455 RepID=UPI003658D104
MLREWTRSDAAAFARAPRPDDDKYSRGVVALHTGSAEYPGAAVLGVEAAWRAGAGYVRYLGGAASAVLARRPETVAGPDIGRTRPGAWVIGSGTDAAARTPAETAVLRDILAGTVPVVVDAGALDLAAEADAPLVLTPHAGELARLRQTLGLTGDGEAVDLAAETAERLRATVLLKGARTVVAAPGEEPIIVSHVPSWLATAGTGDVLAGVVGTLVAANPDRPLAQTAASAVWVHARAAAIASGAVDGAVGHPIVALDVAEALPSAVAELLA